MRIIPPLIIAKREIDLALSIMEEALSIVETDQPKLSEIIPKNCRSGPFINGLIKASPSALLKKMWSTSPQQWLKKVRSFREHA